MDGDLPMRVLSNALVNVLIPGSPEGLDPQNSTCTFIKFNRLGDKGKERHTQSKPPWVAGRRFIPASKGGTSTHTSTHTHKRTAAAAPQSPTCNQQGHLTSSLTSGRQRTAICQRLSLTTDPLKLLRTSQMLWKNEPWSRGGWGGRSEYDCDEGGGNRPSKNKIKMKPPLVPLSAWAADTRQLLSARSCLAGLSPSADSTA